MESLIKEHLEKFGIEPYIIGIFWDDIDLVRKNIQEAIKNNRPYNEYNLLTKEQQKSFDKGTLLF